MALLVTIGSATANSYADTTFATAFFASIGLLTDWTTYNGGDDEEMLLRAMAVIESKDYMGSRANNDGIKQALEFPRCVTHYLGIDPTRLSGTTWTDKRGKEWTDSEIPTPIKQAQCWQAMAEAVNVYRQANEAGEDEEFWAGSVRIRSNPSGSQLRVKIDNSTGSVKALIRPFLARESGQTIRN
jgi:hypothetical protein